MRTPCSAASALRICARICGWLASNPASSLSSDCARAAHRFVALRDGEVVGVLYVGTAPVEVDRDWVAGRFAAPIAAAEAAGLLAARPGGAEPNRGRRICTCFGTGAEEIRTAVRAGARTVAAVGEALSAGTNCGSCRPEIARLIAGETAGTAVAAE